MCEELRESGSSVLNLHSENRESRITGLEVFGTTTVAPGINI